jgi:hypothetical protein
VCGGLVLLLVLAAVLWSPRHRRFYLRTDAGPAPARATQPAVRAEPAGPPPVQHPPAGAADPSRGLAAYWPAGEPPAPGATGAGIARPDPDGRLRIPIADGVPTLLPASGPPAGWELKELAGQATIALVRDDDRLALLARSDRGSFVLYRDVVVDLTRQPLLEWWWKATALPAGGDARSPELDDQAAQLYLVAPRWPFPRLQSRVVGYLWDTRAPVGTRVVRPDAPNVRSIVVESGPERLGTWIRERRDVRADFTELFGEEPGRVGMIGIMSDSDHTGSHGEALFGDLVFFGSPAGNAGFRNLYATIPAILRGNHEP